ncbi:hypothetical protein GX48_08393 [Paracoccidioides brasiliensis]|nr:hypothetical protein GX48_08393 [Paracoccidioides brasiliensis]
MSTSKNIIYLSETKDWDDWLYVIESYMDSIEFRPYINLDTEIPPPENPGSFTTTAESVPVYMHSTLVYEHHSKTKAYDDYIKNKKLKHAYIMEHLSRDDYTITKGKDTPRDIILILKEAIALSTRQRQHDIQIELESLCLGLKNKEITQWIHNLHQFINAVKAIDPMFAEIERTSIVKRNRKNKPMITMTELINNYRDHHRTTIEDEIESMLKNSVFSAATYQSQSTQSMNNPRTTEDATINEKNCLQPAGFNPKAEAYTKIQEAYKRNDRLPGIVNNIIMNWKQKKDKKNTTTRSTTTITTAVAPTEKEDEDSTLHLSRFANKETNLTVITGNSEIQVKGRGDVKLTVKGAAGMEEITLLNTVYISNFHTNIAAALFFNKAGLMANELNHTITTRTGAIRFYLQRIHEKFVLEYKPVEQESVFAVYLYLDPPTSATSLLWHKQLGQPNPKVLLHDRKDIRHIDGSVTNQYLSQWVKDKGSLVEISTSHTPQ